MPTESHHSVSDQPTQRPIWAEQAWEEEILSQLPADFEQQAHRLGAFVRVRGISSVADLLRGLLAYVLCAPSFRQLGLWGVLAQVADLSHIAWRKRLLKARCWLLWLLIEMLAVQEPIPARCFPVERILLIDATRLKAPGGTGDDWRAHLGYELLSGRLLDVKLSDGHTAEGFTLFDLHPGDLVIADRGYCRRKQLVFAHSCGAWLLVRLAVRQIPLVDQAGQPFDVLAWLKQQRAGQHAARVSFEQEDGQRLGLRLIAASLPHEQAERARQKERKKASKQQRQVQEDTLFLCGWFLLISTAPAAAFSDEALLALYRARWQIELVIKRLKPLLKLTQLRGRSVQTNEAILLAVLLAFALLQGPAARLRQDLGMVLATVSQIEAFQPRHRPDGLAPAQSLACVSSWEVLALCAQTLRLLVKGQWHFAHLHACLPRLRRYLCCRSGKRGHQETQIRHQILALLSPRLPAASRLFFCSSA